MNPPPILVGTSLFTATGRDGSFYPKGMRSADYTAFYAEHFDTIEVDSTFYACPTARTVNHWAARISDGLVFSAKVPQTITHEKVLLNCDARFSKRSNNDDHRQSRYSVRREAGLQETEDCKNA